MSRFMVNKFIRFVEMSDEHVERYKQDSAATVDGWLATISTPDGASDDHLLTPDERDAFVARDYTRLYELGAHPYLLWHFVEAYRTPETAWPDLNVEYREAVAPLGYPDYVV